MAAGRVADAEASFRQAIALDPDHGGAHNNLGVLLQQSGRVEEAIKEHAAAFAIDPNDAGALTNLAAAQARQGNADRAIELFVRAAELDPDARTTARDNLAVALVERGRFTEAVAQYEELLRRRPDDADLHRRVAIALVAGGRTDEAIVHLRRAVALAPQSAEARGELARLLGGEGDGQ
jgi:Flp pilus assembly protein TadD